MSDYYNDDDYLSSEEEFVENTEEYCEGEDEDEARKEVAIEFGIRSVPTLVKIDENGNVAGRLVGVRAKNLVEEFLND